jgi:hypothetical protein
VFEKLSIVVHMNIIDGAGAGSRFLRIPIRLRNTDLYIDLYLYFCALNEKFPQATFLCWSFYNAQEKNVLHIIKSRRKSSIDNIVIHFTFLSTKFFLNFFPIAKKRKIGCQKWQYQSTTSGLHIVTIKWK